LKEQVRKEEREKEREKERKKILRASDVDQRYRNYLANM
jgi:hypothetical protein